MNTIREGSTVRTETGGEGDKSRQYRWINKDKITYYLNPDLMEKRNGIVHFKCGDYLKKYHPNEYPKYLKHVEDFEKHFSNLQLI